MEKKTEIIILRVTKTMKDSLMKNAIKAGLVFSEYIRKILDEKN